MGLLYGVGLSARVFSVRYPWGSAAGNVIGYVSHESVGVAGIEAGLDDMLAGIDGVRRFSRGTISAGKWSIELQ